MAFVEISCRMNAKREIVALRKNKTLFISNGILEKEKLSQFAAMKPLLDKDNELFAVEFSNTITNKSYCRKDKSGFLMNISYVLSAFDINLLESISIPYTIVNGDNDAIKFVIDFKEVKCLLKNAANLEDEVKIIPKKTSKKVNKIAA